MCDLSPSLVGTAHPLGWSVFSAAGGLQVQKIGLQPLVTP
jgi:hypothetical protein